MKNLIKLFKKLPEIGFGDPVIFKGSDEDLKLAYKIIESTASIEVIILRAMYLKNNRVILEFGEWIDCFVIKENYFCSYLFNNYSFIEGNFLLGKSVEELDFLAKKLLKIKEII